MISLFCPKVPVIGRHRFCRAGLFFAAFTDASIPCRSHFLLRYSSGLGQSRSVALKRVYEGIVGGSWRVHPMDDFTLACIFCEAEAARSESKRLKKEIAELISVNWELVVLLKDRLKDLDPLLQQAQHG